MNSLLNQFNCKLFELSYCQKLIVLRKHNFIDYTKTKKYSMIFIDEIKLFKLLTKNIKASQSQTRKKSLHEGT